MATAPRFHRATSGTLLIGAGVPGLRELLDVPGVAVAEHPDMDGVLWGKLVLNLNNALNALCGLPLAQELADRALATPARRADRGGARRAEGRQASRRPASKACRRGAIPFILRLPDWLFRRVARRMLAIDPAARSSMWEDLALRRPTEIDYLQGAILALADKVGRGGAAHRAHRCASSRGAESAGAGSPELRPEQVASVYETRRKLREEGDGRRRHRRRRRARRAGCDGRADRGRQAR